jgi:hypothetical protein
MIARLQYAKALFSAGLYEKRGAVALLVGVSSLVIAAADLLMQISLLPATSLPPVVAAGISSVGPWAMLVGMVAQFVQAQSKKVLPPTPNAVQPSLLDDERGS